MTMRRGVRHVALLMPTIGLVFACTAVPIELRPVTAGVLAEMFDFRVEASDMIANVLGYIPLGIVLARRGPWSAIALAMLISSAAEVTQIVTKGRSPSLIDVATNVGGAALGVAIYARWAFVDRVAVSARRAFIAAILALAYVAVGGRVTPVDIERVVEGMIAAPPWLPVNDRGSTSAGRLEAYWPFERVIDGLTPDASGNGLSGALIGNPPLVAGVAGDALALNGIDQWLDTRNPPGLRLRGSITIMAWINSSAFPVDDAAIVSDFSGLGYQLDTTIDRGPRLIGFKLAGTWGRPMARYGRTPMVTNRWYHVAGVFDAAAKSLNVYLNGRLDNGCLAGYLTSRQHVSGENAYVGRRGNLRGFEFAGAIDEVRIYSRALTAPEIAAGLRSSTTSLPPPMTDANYTESREEDGSDQQCPPFQSTDARIVGLIVGCGMLVAIAAAGLWPARGVRVVALTFSVAAGFALVPSIAPLLPKDMGWIVPILTLAGGASVAASTWEETTAAPITTDRRGSRARKNSG